MRPDIRVERGARAASTHTIYKKKYPAPWYGQLNEPYASTSLCRVGRSEENYLLPPPLPIHSSLSLKISAPGLAHADTAALRL